MIFVISQPHEIRESQKINELHELIYEQPQQAIPRLLELKAAHPCMPVISNFLQATYSGIGNDQASRELALENYQNHPDYLFAKINDAQHCLYDGDFAKIPEIFEEKFDLKLQYPSRDKFHITEFVGFNGVMCAYFSVIGKRDAAKLYYESLIQVAPE